MIARIEQVLRDNHELVVAQLRLADRSGQLAERRYPHCLWIDCPASGAAPARAIEIGPQRGGFVHRHVAMLASRADGRLPQVVRYAVQVQKVNHIIVCGHYGDAAAAHVDAQWLRVREDTEPYFWKEIGPLDAQARRDRLVELNVVEQVQSLSETDVVRHAWRYRGRPTLHAWVFDPLTGYLHLQARMAHNDAALREARTVASPALSH